MDIKKMNLLPKEYQKEFEVDTVAFVRNSLVIVLALAIVISLALGQYQLYATDKEIQELSSQKSNLESQNNAVIRATEELKILEDEWRVYENVATTDIDMYQVLQDITDITPDDIWFESIELIRQDDGMNSESEVDNSEAVNETADVDEASTENEEQDSDDIQSVVSGELTVEIYGYSQHIASISRFAYLLNNLTYMDQVNVEYSSEINVYQGAEDTDNINVIEFLIFANTK